jgi:hypothetical protein
MKTYPDLGILIPEIYLPGPGVDLAKWGVIAVDQFTSQPEYWDQVEHIVGDAPSTLRITLPEIYLEQPDEAQRIQRIQATARQYLDAGLLQPHEGLIYVERTAGGRIRKGLMLGLDLECYDYTTGSTSLIRATEGTIVERLPPRMKIREDAALELPHILVLIDDPQRTVIEPISAVTAHLEKLYDFDLMLDSGHLRGYAVNDSALEDAVISALRDLAQPDTFAVKYDITIDRPVLLFAMGDGNHSLAAAKAVWEKIKSTVGMQHPARYALVEIENVHDEGLEFEPIHRVLFDLKQDFFAALNSAFGANFTYTPVASAEEMISRVDAAHIHAAHIHTAHGQTSIQSIGLVGGGAGRTFGVIEIAHASSNLPVGTIQAFLDAFLKAGGAEKIDYVHGHEVTVRLGCQPGNAGIYLPAMDKGDLFKTVILDGALPRKTFSMGEASEKRFYMEARQIA